MLNTILGVGMLAMPRAFAHGGLFWGFILSTFAAALNVFTNHLLLACQWQGKRPSTFKMLAESSGVPYLSLLINTGVVINCVGTSCSYVIVATDCFVSVVGGRRYAWTLMTMAIVTPLSYLRSMDSLRFTSLLSILSVGLIVLVVVLFYAMRRSDASPLDPCPSSSSGESENASCPRGAVVFTGGFVSTLASFSSLSMAYQVRRARHIDGCRPS